MSESRGPQLPMTAFFRFGAVVAVIAVICIVLAQLIFQPGASAAGISGLIETYADPVFQAQSVSIIVQVMAMFTALVAVAVKVFLRSPGLVILALAFLIFWQLFELMPRSVDFFTFSRIYAEGYETGELNGSSTEEAFVRFLNMADGMRSMRQILWSAGLLTLGIAACTVHGVGRWVGGLLLLNGARVATIFTLSMAGTAMPFGRWAFIVVNTCVFSVLAYWLWTMPWQERPAMAPAEERGVARS